MAEEEREDRNIVGKYTNTSQTEAPDAGLAQLQLDVSKVLMQLEHDLKGEYLDAKMLPDGSIQEEWKKGKETIMNEEGVRYVIAVLRTYLTPNTFLSVVDDEDIEHIMGGESGLHFHLACLIVDNNARWDLKPEYWNTIEDKITDTVWLALKRASKGGKTLDSFTRAHTSTEIRTERAPRKKMLGIF
jgi:hypothetical protein